MQRGLPRAQGHGATLRRIPLHSHSFTRMPPFHASVLPPTWHAANLKDSSETRKASTRLYSPPPAPQFSEAVTHRETLDLRSKRRHRPRPTRAPEAPSPSHRTPFRAARPGRQVGRSDTSPRTGGHRLQREISNRESSLLRGLKIGAPKARMAVITGGFNSRRETPKSNSPMGALEKRKSGGSWEIS